MRSIKACVVLFLSAISFNYVHGQQGDFHVLKGISLVHET